MKKIILIDDNSKNQRASYGASFVDRDEYEDCLIHVEKLNGRSDFSFLDDAECVMLHDSLDDYEEGHFVSGSRVAREIILDHVTANNTSYVVFSDGYSLIGDWDSSRNVVKNIKKSEFYKNLKSCLDYYRETHKLDLRIVAYGDNFQKRELVYVLQQIERKLAMHNNKEVMTFSIVDEPVCRQFFDKISYLDIVNFNQVSEEVKAGKLTVGRFRGYLNILTSRAVRYTAKSPKKHILLLGNEQSKDCFREMSNVSFTTLTTFPTGEKGENDLFHNIATTISDYTDGIIIDVDSALNPDACLSYAMAVRLSVKEIKGAALAPIIFMSRMTSDIFRDSPYATILQTRSVSFETPSYTPVAMEFMEPLGAKDYHPYFLDVVKVKPNATEGRHSIANQWGADVLNRMFQGEETTNKQIKEARQSLYFKYVLAQTRNPQTIQCLTQNEEVENLQSLIDVVDASGKKILVIDDEADKGWGEALSRILKNADITIFNTPVSDYNGLSTEIKDNIENFDLIFLDLRLDGQKEDKEGYIRPKDFSGMKVLKAIKKINPGIQIIMLTASNKAWNMKALFDGGADGYYIKESPEYSFPTKYSLANAENLVVQIEECLNRNYLRTIFRRLRTIKKYLTDIMKYESKMQSTCDRIKNQLEMAYSLLKKANTKREFAFAFVTLEQIFELITSEYIITDDNGYYIIKCNGDYCAFWSIDSNGDCEESQQSSLQCEYPREDMKYPYPQWQQVATLYYNLFEGRERKFGATVKTVIDMRNAFIHNDSKKINDLKNYQDIFNKDGFLMLYDTIFELISVMN